MRTAGKRPTQDTATGPPLCARAHGQVPAGPAASSTQWSSPSSISERTGQLRGFSGNIASKFPAGTSAKNFFQSLWAFSCPAYAPPAMTLQEKSTGHQQTCFPFRSGYGGPPPRIEPRLPLSSPLIKQRGAAPPASCRQAPHELRPLPQRQIPQNAFPLRQYPSPQHNPRQHQDLIAARPAMEPREGPHTLRDARVWSTNGSSSSSGDRRAREAHRPQIPLH